METTIIMGYMGDYRVYYKSEQSRDKGLPLLSKTLRATTEPHNYGSLSGGSQYDDAPTFGHSSIAFQGALRRAIARLTSTAIEPRHASPPTQDWLLLMVG